MKHPIRLLTTVAISVSLVACTSAAGSLGPLPSAIPTDPAATPASPGLSPRPSTSPSAAPSSRPSSTHSPAPSSAPSASPAGPTATAKPAPAATTTLRAYFFLGGAAGSAGLVPVLREVAATKAVATAAMNALLEGPNASDRGASVAISTTIPQGTKLLGLSIADGVARVDLSREFESGGGSASCLGRLGQVVYTLTQFRTVDSVSFQIDGRPVRVFGCEGIVLDGPVGRSTDRFGQTLFEDLLPAIFVDRPAWGAALDNPAEITGTANVFEAQFMLTLIDGSGREEVEVAVSAGCGSGCRGSFTAFPEGDLIYYVAKPQWGTLRVWDVSERDGSPELVREYPVWLTPEADYPCGC